MFITDSEKQMSTIRSAETLAKEKTVTLTPGADTAKYDSATNTLYVVTGGKDVDMKTANLEAVNPDTGDRKALLTFPDNHVEAMAFVEGDPRLFINLTQTNKLAVVDRKTMKVLTSGLCPRPNKTRWSLSIKRNTGCTLSADSPGWSS